MMTTIIDRIAKSKKCMSVLLIGLLGLFATYPYIMNIVKNALNAYLSVDKPVPGAQVLIVEGWLFGHLIPNVKKEFEAGRFSYILVSWQPQESGPTDTRSTIPARDRERIARTLMSLGIDSSKIIVVKVHPESTHNTLVMALAIKKWFLENDPAVSRVNVCTVGDHGRKTWIAYKRALGKSFGVGILSFRQKQFPVSLWWKDSDGGMRWHLLRWIGAVYVAWWPLSWVSDK
jgi:hypothetical protein